jgi:hypothetical protein
MRNLAETIAREWCYPEEHHSMKVELTYHCANDGKSARVPRIDIRGDNGLWESYVGYEAVCFLTLLNEECQELLK